MSGSTDLSQFSSKTTVIVEPEIIQLQRKNRFKRKLKPIKIPEAKLNEQIIIEENYAKNLHKFNCQKFIKQFKIRSSNLQKSQLLLEQKTKKQRIQI